MARLPKTERNRFIVELRKKGWTFKRIAKELGLRARSTVHEIYTNELTRSGNRSAVKLSTPQRA